MPGLGTPSWAGCSSPPTPTTSPPRCSASVEAGLQEQLATAQRIMRLAQLSRPHQLPGEAGAAAAEAPAGEAALGASAAEEEAAACSGTASDSPGAMQALGLPAGGAGQRLLEAFSRRCGAAALDAAALERERLRLAAENATLAAVVATVQAGGGVAPGALDDPLNTLCVVNGRLQVALRAAGAQRGQ